MLAAAQRATGIRFRSASAPAESVQQDSSESCGLTRLASVSLHLTLQRLDAKSLLRASNTCRALKSAAQHPFAWQCIQRGPVPSPAVVFDCTPGCSQASSAFYSPLLRRFLPVRASLLGLSADRFPVSRLAPRIVEDAGLGNVTVLDGFWLPPYLTVQPMRDIESALHSAGLQNLREAEISGSRLAREVPLQRALFRLPQLQSLSIASSSMCAPLSVDVVGLAKSPLRCLDVSCIDASDEPIEWLEALGQLPWESLSFRGFTDPESPVWFTFDQRFTHAFQMGRVLHLALSNSFTAALSRTQLSVILRACVHLRSLRTGDSPEVLRCILRAMIRLACEERKTPHRPRPLTALADIRLCTRLSSRVSMDGVTLGRKLLGRFFRAYPQLECRAACVVDSSAPLWMQRLCADLPRRLPGVASATLHSRRPGHDWMEHAILKQPESSSESHSESSSAGEPRGHTAPLERDAVEFDSDSDREPEEFSDARPEGESQALHSDFGAGAASLPPPPPPPSTPPPQSAPAEGTTGRNSSEHTAAEVTESSAKHAEAEQKVRGGFTRLAPIEIHLVMHCLDAKSLLRITNTCRALKAAAEHPFAWRGVENGAGPDPAVVFDCSSDGPQLSSAFLSPLLRRFLPVAATLDNSSRDSAAHLHATIAHLGNVTALLDFWTARTSAGTVLAILELPCTQQLREVKFVLPRWTEDDSLQRTLFRLPKLQSVVFAASAMTAGLQLDAVPADSQIRRLEINRFGSGNSQIEWWAAFGQACIPLHTLVFSGAAEPRSQAWISFDRITTALRLDCLQRLECCRFFMRELSQQQLSIVFRACVSLRSLLADEAAPQLQTLFHALITIAEEERTAQRLHPLQHLSELRFRSAMAIALNGAPLERFFRAYPWLACASPCVVRNELPWLGDHERALFQDLPQRLSGVATATLRACKNRDVEFVIVKQRVTPQILRGEGSFALSDSGDSRNPPPPPSTPSDVSAPTQLTPVKRAGDEEDANSEAVSGSAGGFTRMATVELHLVMHCLDAKSLLRTANTCRALKCAVEHPFAWHGVEHGPVAVVFDCRPGSSGQPPAFDSPLLRRYLPVEAVVGTCAPEQLQARIGHLGNVAMVRGFWQMLAGSSDKYTLAMLQLPCIQQMRGVIIDEKTCCSWAEQRALFRLPRLESLIINAEFLSAPLLLDAVQPATQLRRLEISQLQFLQQPLQCLAALGEARIPLLSLKLSGTVKVLRLTSPIWPEFEKITETLRCDCLERLEFDDRCTLLLKQSQLCAIFRACISLQSLHVIDDLSCLQKTLRALIQLVREERMAGRHCRPLLSLNDVRLRCLFSGAADLDRPKLPAPNPKLLARFFRAFPQLECRSECALSGAVEQLQAVFLPESTRGVSSIRLKHAGRWVFSRIEFVLSKQSELFSREFVSSSNDGCAAVAAAAVGDLDSDDEERALGSDPDTDSSSDDSDDDDSDDEHAPPPPPDTPPVVAAGHTDSNPACRFTRLAAVEIHLVMQCLDAKSLLRASNTCRALKSAAEHPFAWRCIERGPAPDPAVVFDCAPDCVEWPAYLPSLLRRHLPVSASSFPAMLQRRLPRVQSSSAFDSALLRRFLPVRVLPSSSLDQLTAQLACLGNVTALDRFWLGPLVSNSSTKSVIAVLRLPAMRLREAELDLLESAALQRALLRLPQLASIRIRLSTQSVPLQADLLLLATQLRRLEVKILNGFADRPNHPRQCLEAFGQARIPLQTLLIHHAARDFEPLAWLALRLDCLQRLEFSRSATSELTRTQLCTAFRACVSLRSLWAEDMPDKLNVILRGLLRLACEERRAGRPRALLRLDEIRITSWGDSTLGRALLGRFFRAYPWLECESACVVSSTADESCRLCAKLPQRLPGVHSASIVALKGGRVRNIRISILRQRDSDCSRGSAAERLPTGHEAETEFDTDSDPDEFDAIIPPPPHSPPAVSAAPSQLHPSMRAGEDACFKASRKADAAERMQAASGFTRLASVEVHLVMHCLDAKSLLRCANTCRALKSAADHPFAWREIQRGPAPSRTVVFDCTPDCSQSSSAFLSPLLRRFLPVRASLLGLSAEQFPVSRLAQCLADAQLGNVVALDEFWASYLTTQPTADIVATLQADSLQNLREAEISISRWTQDEPLQRALFRLPQLQSLSMSTVSMQAPLSFDAVRLATNLRRLEVAYVSLGDTPIEWLAAFSQLPLESLSFCGFTNPESPVWDTFDQRVTETFQLGRLLHLAMCDRFTAALSRTQLSVILRACVSLRSLCMEDSAQLLRELLRAMIRLACEERKANRPRPLPALADIRLCTHLSPRGLLDCFTLGRELLGRFFRAYPRLECGTACAVNPGRVLVQPNFCARLPRHLPGVASATLSAHKRGNHWIEHAILKQPDSVVSEGCSQRSDAPPERDANDTGSDSDCEPEEYSDAHSDGECGASPTAASFPPPPPPSTPAVSASTETPPDHCDEEVETPAASCNERTGGSVLASEAGERGGFDRLALVEIHLVLHFLDAKSLLRCGNASKALHSTVSMPFAWSVLSAADPSAAQNMLFHPFLRFHHPVPSSAFLSPLARAHLPVVMKIDAAADLRALATGDVLAASGVGNIVRLSGLNFRMDAAPDEHGVTHAEYIEQLLRRKQMQRLRWMEFRAPAATAPNLQRALFSLPHLSSLDIDCSALSAPILADALCLPSKLTHVQLSNLAHSRWPLEHLSAFAQERIPLLSLELSPGFLAPNEALLFATFELSEVMQLDSLQSLTIHHCLVARLPNPRAQLCVILRACSVTLRTLRVLSKDSSHVQQVWRAMIQLAREERAAQRPKPLQALELIRQSYPLLSQGRPNRSLISRFFRTYPMLYAPPESFTIDSNWPPNAWVGAGIRSPMNHRPNGFAVLRMQKRDMTLGYDAHTIEYEIRRQAVRHTPVAPATADPFGTDVDSEPDEFVDDDGGGEDAQAAAAAAASVPPPSSTPPQIDALASGSSDVAEEEHKNAALAEREETRAGGGLKRLASVEIHLVMHCLDAKSLLRCANTYRTMRSAAQHPFAWCGVENGAGPESAVVFDCTPGCLQSAAFDSPLLRRHLPVRASLLGLSAEQFPVSRLAQCLADAQLGNVVALDEFWASYLTTQPTADIVATLQADSLQNLREAEISISRWTQDEPLQRALFRLPQLESVSILVSAMGDPLLLDAVLPATKLRHLELRQLGDPSSPLEWLAALGQTRIPLHTLTLSDATLHYRSPVWDEFEHIGRILRLDCLQRLEFANTHNFERTLLQPQLSMLFRACTHLRWLQSEAISAWLQLILRALIQLAGEERKAKRRPLLMLAEIRLRCISHRSRSLSEQLEESALGSEWLPKFFRAFSHLECKSPCVISSELMEQAQPAFLASLRGLSCVSLHTNSPTSVPSVEYVLCKQFNIASSVADE